MKLLLLSALILLVSCNPELQNVGADKNDLVKYFKITKASDPNALGEGVLIIAHAGDKRILTFYLKNANGYSHSDVTIATKNGFILDSVYSKSPACKLSPDVDQPDYMNFLMINGQQKPYKLEILPREEAMAMLSNISC